MPGECSPPTAADWAQNAADHAREDARKNGTTIAKLEARLSALEDLVKAQQQYLAENSDRFVRFVNACGERLSALEKP